MKRVNKLEEEKKSNRYVWFGIEVYKNVDEESNQSSITCTDKEAIKIKYVYLIMFHFIKKARGNKCPCPWPGRGKEWVSFLIQPERRECLDPVTSTI